MEVLKVIKSIGGLPFATPRGAAEVFGTGESAIGAESSAESALSLAAPSSSDAMDWGRQAARNAAHQLFAEAATLADDPMDSWVCALPFAELHQLARVCAYGRHTSMKTLTTNQARRFMSAIQRAIFAHNRAPGGVHALAPQHIAMTAYWSARVGRMGGLSSTTAHRLFPLLADMTLERGVHSLGNAWICQLLWTYVRVRNLLGGGPDPLAVMVAEGLTFATWTTNCSPRDSEAARHAGQRCRELVLALHCEAVSRVPTLSPTELARVTWTVGMSGLPAQPLLQALAQAIPPAVAHMNAGELSNCLWTFSCRGFFPKRATTALVESLNARDDEERRRTLTPGHAVQLQAVALALRIEGPWVLRPTPELDPRLLGAGIDAGLSAGIEGAESSPLHLQVSRLLTEMGTGHENEARVAALGCTVDILISDLALIVEVLGPTHYAFGGRELVTTTALKLRLLRLLGWDVVELPYFEWNALGQSAHAKREFLERKVGVAALPALPDPPRL